MKDAFGGILNLVIISVFLVIVSGVLTFIVSYTRAFQFKNAVISAFERFEGAGCTESGTACADYIDERAEGIGSFQFTGDDFHCPSGFEHVEGKFCYKEESASNLETEDFFGNPKVYTISVAVRLNIPIINQVFNFHFFRVSGTTRIIYVK